jgi:uncharacterized protein (TIGR02284 family)
MSNQDELASVLNDLIKINNDRIEGYHRALGETKDTDVDLKAMCKQMADQSMKYVNELTQEVARLGEDATTSTTISGKAYRVWMDLKAAVSGHSKKSVLENCEFGEDVAQKAYDAALESDSYMTTEIRQLIANQKSELKTAHDTVRNYRDMQEKVS